MSGFGDVSDERIGDHERDAAVANLTAHREQGRLTSEQFEERQVRATGAQTWGDVVPLFADLPEPRPAKVTALSAYAAPGRPVPAPGPAVPTSADQLRTAIPDHLRERIMALTPFAALILFFLTGYNWLWFLAIPIMGILLYGRQGRPGGRDRDRRRDRH